MNFADLVNNLFTIYKRPDGTEYTNREVAAAIGCDPSYLTKVRRGSVTNPSRDTLLQLCYFFNVKPSYFFPELGEEQLMTPEDQLEAALRSSGIDEQKTNIILDLFNMFRKQNRQ